MSSAWFWEPIAKIISFDLVGIIGIIFDNLGWFFLLYCFCYFFYNKKSTLKMFILVVLIIWLYHDFTHMMGWAVFIASFLALTYLSRVIALTWAENSASLKKHMGLIYIIVGHILLLVYNIFLR